MENTSNDKSFSLLLRRLFFFPLFVALCTAGILVWQNQRLLSLNQWADHSSEVISQIQKVEGLLTEVESGWRGYRLTRQSDFLVSSTKTLEVLDSELKHLKNSIQDNGTQVDRLRAAEASIRDWLRLYQLGISLNIPVGHKAAVDLQQAAHLRFDGIKALFSNILSTEQALRIDRLRAVQWQGRVLNVFAVVTLLSLGFIIFFYSRKQLKDLSLIYERAIDSERKRSLLLEESESQSRALLSEHEALLKTSEKANQLKDEFLATLSHELRTPLNAIVGWSEILKGEEAGSPHFRQGLETINRNAQIQASMINDLLDVSRILSGKLVLSAEKVDLRQLAQLAIESCKLSALAKDISISLTYPENQNSFVVGDSSRLQQVIWNLIANAVKFTPRKGKIDLSISVQNKNILLKVKDSGIGIQAEFIPHVFDRFRQGDSSITRNFGGLGLGLAIVRSLVELHGGKVGVESAGMNRGTCFTVTFPEAKASSLVVSPVMPPATQALLQNESAQADLLPATQLALSENFLKGIVALVVDDTLDAREVVSLILRTYGAEVIPVESAERAFEVIRLKKPDVLISDIGMPGEDGYEFLKRLRKFERTRGDQWRTPAAALTAYARESEIALAFSAGFDLHIPKPVDATSLAHAVAKLAKMNAKA